MDLWRKVVGRSPDNRDAREGLARSALERQAPVEALEWLEPLLERDDVRSSTMHLAQRAVTLAGELLAQKPEEPFIQQLTDALRNQKPLPPLDLIPLTQH